MQGVLKLAAFAIAMIGPDVVQQRLRHFPISAGVAVRYIGRFVYTRVDVDFGR